MYGVGLVPDSGFQDHGNRPETIHDLLGLVSNCLGFPSDMEGSPASPLDYLPVDIQQQLLRQFLLDWPAAISSRDWSRIFSDSARNKRRSPLENLPAEIRREVLLLLDFRELLALVNASPVFHEQYLADHKSVMCSWLQRALGDAAIEARAVHQAGIVGSLDPDSPEWPDVLRRFLDTYRARSSRVQSDRVIPFAALPKHEVKYLIFFHLNVILPLSRRFTSWASMNLAKMAKTEYYAPLLSRAEETRVVRALYRFQLCCCLFGRATCGDDEGSDWGNRVPLSMTGFFDTMEPWEIEEVACICDWIMEEYEYVFRAIQWDVHPDNPRFKDQGGTNTSDGSFDLENEEHRSDLLVGTLACGLEPLEKVLFRTQTHDDLVATMQTYVGDNGSFDPVCCWWKEPQQAKREAEISSGQRLQQRPRDHSPVQWSDDVVKVESGSPNFAWTFLWNNTYSNLYGEFIPNNLTHWGYVMWDFSRLVRMGAMSVLDRKWLELHRGGDPRGHPGVPPL
ncbi:uncharacterized protein B0T15DRAFT_235219 [Chaetomium strumarium]|uniref:F-box domain-containing protein n=1 Tax=Chaetomium strumarium TaxID=1170767 RepID=A0AAJ0M0F1_9PEZI|nr:hypothetical protein B0T15DRAFT_235219 [Chaetomium strumarium]